MLRFIRVFGFSSFLIMAVAVQPPSTSSPSHSNAGDGTDSIKGDENPKTVYVIVVIDTDSLCHYFRDRSPSKDQNNPTLISGANYAYMVTSSANIISGQATADLHLKANLGDIINWKGTTPTNNFVSPVLVYNVQKLRGDDILDVPTFSTFEKKSIQPERNEPFPVKLTKQKFWFLKSTAIKKGWVIYKVRFGVYEFDRKGNRQLFGYFEWDPKITIE